MRLPLLCEKSGAILLVLMDLAAGKLTGWQSDEIPVDSKVLNSLQIASLGFLWCLTKVQCYYSVTYAFQSVFWSKVAVL